MKKENVSKLGKMFVNSENEIKQFEIIGVLRDSSLVLYFLYGLYGCYVTIVNINLT